MTAANKMKRDPFRLKSSTSRFFSDHCEKRCVLCEFRGTSQVHVAHQVRRPLRWQTLVERYIEKFTKTPRDPTGTRRSPVAICLATRLNGVCACVNAIWPNGVSKSRGWDRVRWNRYKTGLSTYHALFPATQTFSSCCKCLRKITLLSDVTI